MKLTNVTSKIKDLIAISRQLNERSDVYAAVSVWTESYNCISPSEFLECSEEWNSQEILNILNEDIMMFTWAKQAIEKHLNETQNEQD